jgi:hypothetical protein
MFLSVPIHFHVSVETSLVWSKGLLHEFEPRLDNLTVGQYQPRYIYVDTGAGSKGFEPHLDNFTQG